MIAINFKLSGHMQQACGVTGDRTKPTMLKGCQKGKGRWIWEGGSGVAIQRVGSSGDFLPEGEGMWWRSKARWEGCYFPSVTSRLAYL